jgi:hypothetical protein
MMTDYEGDTTVNIDGTAIESIARYIDTTEEQRVDLLRKQIGAKKCDRLRATVTASHTVNELFIATNVDRHNLGRSDYTQRRVFAIGNYPIDTNSVAHLVGTTHPNPRDSHNEFYAWDLKPATTSIDDFQMTPELAEQLSIFQTAKGQKPIQKCREIAEELSQSVTQIIGRERLHMCIDLVYHSVLNFYFDGKLMERGWLEFIVVGDTRTGKSKTATQLADYYGLGHVVGCESATFAGLVGGVKQIGKDWTIQWGEITVNDRRLVVLDEVSGLSQEIISRMSDVRARGVAQVTAIETRTTKARTRLIWISNPRKPKFIDEKKIDGIDILEDLIGNPEDISRFDLAMSVRSEDISNDMINVPRPSSATRYTKELCHSLILWAWSRKPEHIVWEGTAHSDVFHAAKWLGKLYVAHPPLVQGANAREKVARLAVAMAARTFSTDATGQQIIVTRQHVQDAMNFIHELCKYDNFGYYRRSKRIRRNQAIAKSKRDDIKMFLRENRRVFEFLLDRTGSFRAQDLEEMAFMHRDEVNNALGILSDAKMITKEKSQIVLEPELQEILKEMERK